MSNDAANLVHEQNQERLRYLRVHFEQKERQEFGQHARERTDEEKELLSEYIQLNLKYGGPHPVRDSGLVVFYRKLLKLQNDAK